MIPLNRDCKPTIFIHIDEEPVKALTDTGSGITQMSEKLVEQCIDYTIEATSVEAYTITSEITAFRFRIYGYFSNKSRSSHHFPWITCRDEFRRQTRNGFITDHVLTRSVHT